MAAVLFVFLLVTPTLFAADDCSKLQLTAKDISPGTWRIAVESDAYGPFLTGVVGPNLQWTLEEAENHRWQQVLSGGVGVGVPDEGAKPVADSNAIVPPHPPHILWPLFITDFDLREWSAGYAFSAQAKYRLTFESPVSVSDDQTRTLSCYLRVQTAAFRGSVTGPVPTARIPFQFWTTGDDGLSQRFTASLYRALQSSPVLTPSSGKLPGTFIVQIPTNVDWKKRFGRTMVLYRVNFRSEGGQDLGTSAGSCSSSDRALAKCATEIVRHAETAARKLHE
jgi:hypothetical protein